MKALPELLHPFATDNPASCAYRMHLSPHEWTWTQAEQEAMARALIERDKEVAALRHDRERLDWITAAPADVDSVSDSRGGKEWACYPYSTNSARAATPRDAIDAAMREANEKDQPTR